MSALPPFELRFTFLESDHIERMPLLASRLIEMSNGGGIRFGPRWPELEPEPGVFNYTTLDAGIDAITRAGGHTYADLTDTPGHALCYVDPDGKRIPHPWEGYRTWFPSNASQVRPTCWKQANGVFSPVYDPSISDECANPPRENPDSVRAIGAALAKHCAGKVRSYGNGNERDDPVFYPLFHLSAVNSDNWQIPTKMTYLDSWRPFAEGVRSVMPGAIIEGTESQTYGTFTYALQLEKAFGDHTFDVITTHGYAGKGKSFPDDAIARMTMKDGGLLQYLADYDVRGGRPLGIGEVAREDGDDPYGVLEYIPAMCALGFAFVTLMRLEDYFQPGTFASGKYEPNDLFVRMKQMMQRITSSARHRAAQS